MQGAIFSGIYGLSASQPLSCFSGNCTWEYFQTISVCSSCKNVTLSSVKLCTGSDIMPSRCNYTSPLGLIVCGIHDRGMSTTSTWTLLSATAESTESSLVTIAFVKNSMELDNVGKIAAPEVHECKVRFCARTISGVAVQNSKIHDGTTKAATILLDWAVHPQYNNTIKVQGPEALGYVTYYMNHADYITTLYSLKALFSNSSHTPGTGYKTTPESTQWGITCVLYNSTNIT